MEAKDIRPLMEAVASVYEGYGKKKKGDCVSKSEKGKHNCAKKVCHEEYGEGETIFGQHAVPDENGFVSHYDVQFEHGIVEDVSVDELEIITEGSHNEENHWYEGETISEMDERSPEYNRRKQEAAKEAAHRSRTRGNAGRAAGGAARPRTPITAGGGAPEEHGQVDRYRRMAIDRARQNQRSGGAGRSVQQNSVDLFDIVKGHLLDEGYADTEEAALAIMANMSEEWKQSIVEADMSAANLNSPAHKDRSTEGLSDRQVRMKNFADKRAQMLMRKGRV